MGGDVDVPRDAIGISFEEVPQPLQALQDAIARQDPHGVEAKAHRLMGVMGNFGGMGARAIAQKLEAMDEQANLTEGPGLVDSLANEIGAGRGILSRPKLGTARSRASVR